nr:IS110 family transposase [Streptomyces decoyicus]
MDWVRLHDMIDRAGVECTGSYGAALSRVVRSNGLAVIEVNQPDKATRRRRGKTDTIDAEVAAHAALSGRATATAKHADGRPKHSASSRWPRSPRPKPALRPSLRAAGCGLRAAGCGLRAAGCGLRAAGCGLRAAGATSVAQGCPPGGQPRPTRTSRRADHFPNSSGLAWLCQGLRPTRPPRRRLHPASPGHPRGRARRGDRSSEAADHRCAQAAHA